MDKLDRTALIRTVKELIDRGNGDKFVMMIKPNSMKKVLTALVGTELALENAKKEIEQLKKELALRT